MPRLAPPERPHTTVLLVGHYDPPTLDYSRAIEAIRAAGYQYVWLCPISSGNAEKDRRVSAMTEILGIELGRDKKDWAVCLTGIQKNFDGVGVRQWYERRFPGRKFLVAYLSSDPQSEGVPVVIGNVSKSTEWEPIYVPKHLSCQVDVGKRIAGGGDEHRSFTPLVWNYIKRHGLYAANATKER